MMVPLQTVALALAGMLLLMLSTLWPCLVRLGRVVVPAVATCNVDVRATRVGQLQQWFMPRQWHSWLASRRRSKDAERLLGGWRERLKIALLP